MLRRHRRLAKIKEMLESDVGQDLLAELCEFTKYGELSDPKQNDAHVVGRRDVLTYLFKLCDFSLEKVSKLKRLNDRNKTDDLFEDLDRGR